MAVALNSLKTYEVQVGGCSLKLKSSHDLNTLNEILKIVEEQTEIGSKTHQGSLSVQKNLALCCLHLAEELVCFKRKLSKELESLELSTRSAMKELQKKSSSLELMK